MIDPEIIRALIAAPEATDPSFDPGADETYGERLPVPGHIGATHRKAEIDRLILRAASIVPRAYRHGVRVFDVPLAGEVYYSHLIGWYYNPVDPREPSRYWRGARHG